MENEAKTDIGILDEFQTEFMELWVQIPHKGFFFALLVCWLALFQFLGNATFGYIDTPSLFRWMWTVYWSRDSEGSLGDDSIGLWIPIIVFALIWRKRHELETRSLKLWGPGLLLLAGGIILHLAGFFIQVPHLSILGLLVGIFGLMGTTWGFDVLRKLFFPFFLFIFLIPLSRTLEPITVPLRLYASAIVEWICHIVFAIDVIREGNILRDPGGHYQYEVVAACSGIRSLVAIGLMATIGAFAFFKQWWRRAVLLALVVPLAVVGNGVRLLMIIVSADLWGQSAGNYVHEGGPGGVISLLPYVPAIFGLMYAGRWLEEKKSSPAKAA